MVLDTHTHAWGPPSAQHPWVNETMVGFIDDYAVSSVYTAEDLLVDLDRARVDEAVLVGYPVCRWDDNWYTKRAVAAHDRLYGIGMVDQLADGAAEQLRGLMSVDGMLGFRLRVSAPHESMWEAFETDQEPTWLREAIEERAFWEVARETDAVVQITTDAAQLDQVAALIDRYPDLTYVFDAFGPLTPDATAETRTAFREVAENENTAVKLSHPASVSDESFPFEDLHDEVAWLVETFGRERLAWGSDFPNTTQSGATYAESRNWLYQVDRLTDRDRDWIEGRGFEHHVGVD